MKIIKTFLFILLFILLIMPFTVHAEPTSNEEYEFKLYEFDYIEMMKQVDSVQSEDDIAKISKDYFALSIIGVKEGLIRDETERLENNFPIKMTAYLISTNKPILEIEIDPEKYDYYGNMIYATTMNYSIYDQYTVDDNFTITVTDEDIAKIEGGLTEEQVLQIKEIFPYSRIVVKLSDTDNTKDGVYINRIRLSDKTETATINNSPVVNGLQLDLDLQFKTVGDYAIYRVGIRNNTNKEYQISDDTIYGTDNYIKYEFSFEDGNNVLKPNTEKIMYVKASYDKAVPEEVMAAVPGGGSGFVETRKLEVALINETGDVGNPKTSDNLMTSILVIMVSIALIIVMIKVRALRKTMMIVIAGVILIPVVANAIERLNVTINSKVVIKSLKNQFCVYDINDFEGTTKTYYDFMEGTTWEDYYDENGPFEFNGESGYYMNTFIYNKKPTCATLYSANPGNTITDLSLSNLDFEIVGIQKAYVPVSQRPIECDGSQYVENEDIIMPADTGCYQYRTPGR